MLWVCGKCRTRYAPGLAACPQCGSTDYRPDYEEDTVANITSAGTFYDEGKEPDDYTDPRAEAAAEEPQAEPEPVPAPQPAPAPAPPAPKIPPAPAPGPAADG